MQPTSKLALRSFALSFGNVFTLPRVCFSFYVLFVCFSLLNRIYATFYRNGKGLKELAEYGPDGKRLNSIHLIDHHGLGSHWHPWKSGGQVPTEAYPINDRMKKLINKIKNFEK